MGVNVDEMVHPVEHDGNGAVLANTAETHEPGSKTNPQSHLDGDENATDTPPPPAKSSILAQAAVDKNSPDSHNKTTNNPEETYECTMAAKYE